MYRIDLDLDGRIAQEIYKAKTAAENMLTAWESVGFTVKDPTAEEITTYKAENSTLPERQPFCRCRCRCRCRGAGTRRWRSSSPLAVEAAAHAA